MRLLAAALLLPFAGQDLQEENLDTLISRLGTGSFESQGRAADRIVILGPEALRALEKAPRAWAELIRERIKKNEERVRPLIEKLASDDDETKDKAADALWRIGEEALPWLREAAKSDNKNLRRRAEAVILEIDESEPFEKLKEESDKPFKGKGAYDDLGTGGGGGGRFGSRLGGKTNLVARSGGGAETESAVLSALRWLSRHQNKEGAWDVVGTCKECAPSPGEADYRAGVTGLALLAFLGAGYSHLSRDTFDGIGFGDVIRKGIQWIMAHQDPDGCIGPRESDKYMYGHLLCALAIVEAYGLTGSNLFKEDAQKAVDFTVKAQNPGKGWRYSERAGDNDTSVTGWAVQVLRAAEIAGLPFPKPGYDGARAWLDEVSGDDHRIGYTSKGSGQVYIPKKNEDFHHHETLTAMGMVARMFMDKNKGDARLRGGADLLLRDLPQWKDHDIDFYYWHHASMALFQYDDEAWKKWNGALKDALVKNQNAKDCKKGSWEPVDRWSCMGGRVYATAINALTLETYYRYARVLGR